MWIDVEQLNQKHINSTEHIIPTGHKMLHKIPLKLDSQDLLLVLQ
jgi:hypothetical protein